MPQIQNLLTQVSAINRQYEKIATITGENFNIFKILGLSSREVRTHTAFLGELLNAAGSHGQKETFLELFCEELSFDFDFKNAKCEKEKFIGQIPDDWSEGGGVDLLITDCNNCAIVIENKINANDQKGQLFRYHNYAKRFTNFKLLYLTLDGRDVSNFSKVSETGDEILVDGKQYFRISYAETILRWLEKCKEKAVNFPMLRECITQYIYLIKSLTNQTPNHEMEKELVELISKNGEYFSASIRIEESIREVKKAVLAKFAYKIKEKVVDRNVHGVTIEIHEDFGLQYCGISFYIDEKSPEFVQLSFLADLKEFYLGINKGDADLNTKNAATLTFYEEELKNISHNWGKVENVEKGWGWHNWVCRYRKLDDYFRDLKGWVAIIEDKFDIIEAVSSDIIVLINALKQKNNLITEIVKNKNG